MQYGNCAVSESLQVIAYLMKSTLSDAVEGREYFPHAGGQIAI